MPKVLTSRSQVVVPEIIPVDIQKYQEEAVDASNPIDTTGVVSATVLGSTTDAAVSTDTTGTISGKLRGIIKLLVDKLTIKIDQTTPGITDSVSVATAQGAGATIGTTADAAIVTDTTGSISGKLRGVIKLLVDQITVKLAAGSQIVGKVGIDQTTQGTTNAVAAKIIDTAGTPQGILIEDGAVTTVDYLVAISHGDVPNHTAWERFAINQDIDITEEDVIEMGGTYVPPAAEMGMEIFSASANDTNGGTGINTVTVYYLDDAFTEKTEDVNLNGAVVALAATDIYRVNAVKAKVVGSGGVAAGNISLRHLSDTPVYSMISAGRTRSRNSFYTVPASKSLHISSIYIGATSTANNGATVTLKATYDHDAAASRTFFLPHAEFSLGTGGSGISKVFEIPLTFPAGTDIKLSAISLANNCSVSADFRGWLQSE